MSFSLVPYLRTIALCLSAFFLIVVAGPAAPAALAQADAPLVSIAAGAFHNCALRADDSVYCWGATSQGQSTPPAGSFVQLSAGGTYTCGIRADGSLACWGADDFGRATPPAGTFTQVSAGIYHACGVRTDGSLACWGWNDYGQSTPPAGTFRQVTAGWSFSCGLRTDDTVVCWGEQAYGASAPPGGRFLLDRNRNIALLRHSQQWECGLLGLRLCAGKATPPAGTFTKIAAGIFHTCGITTAGTMVCWGYNGDGQQESPVGTFTQLAAGEYHTCALHTDTTVVCWGKNSAWASAQDHAR